MGLEEFNINIINYWILIPVACIILLLSFLEKRKCRPDICNGRLALIMLSLKVVEIGQRLQVNETDVPSKLEIFDQVMKNLSVALIIFQNLPIIICYLLLIVYCIYILHRCILNRTLYKRQTEGTVRRHQEDHVRWVFKKSWDKTQGGATISSRSLVERMENDSKLRFLTNLPFFKYPTKLCAIVFLQINIIYWLCGSFVIVTINGLSKIYQVFGSLGSNGNLINEHVILIGVCSAAAILMSITTALTHIFIASRNYRYHMLRIFQGGKDFAVQLTGSSQHILTSSMMYPGYQVGFMMWGCVLNFACVFFVLFTISEIIYLGISHYSVNYMFLYLTQTLRYSTNGT